MKLEDRIYGQREINEPVVLELIKSEEIQRLKDISQLGLPAEFNMGRKLSRYEHSVGVFLLLRYFRANLEEQIAGLLHDASHMTFSHVYDWVVGSHNKEDYQDNNHANFLNKTQIPRILNQYGYGCGRIFNLSDYKLLEKNIPDLCVDRIDYFLRQVQNPKEVDYILTSLRIYDRDIVLCDKRSAERFGYSFLKMQIEDWGSPERIIGYHLFAEMLKIALAEGIISDSDFSRTEKPIIEKLKQNKNPEIQKRLKALSEKINYRINEENPSLILKKKFRYVDPLYIRPGGVSKLSENDKEFKELLEKERKLNDLGTRVDIYL